MAFVVGVLCLAGGVVLFPGSLWFLSPRSVFYGVRGYPWGMRKSRLCDRRCRSLCLRSVVVVWVFILGCVFWGLLPRLWVRRVLKPSCASWSLCLVGRVMVYLMNDVCVSVVVW